MKTQVLDGGCQLIELFPRSPVARKKPKTLKPRRPMTYGEYQLVRALQNYCSAGHWFPIWEWKFLQDMSDAGPITDKQGDYIRTLAAKYGIGSKGAA